MFTMKRIAFLGLAGLTAFTMSCSDDDDGNPGGEFASFTAALTNNKVVIGGQVTASGDANLVTGLTVLADGTAIPAASVTGLPATLGLTDDVTFSGVVVSGICKATNTTTDKEFTISAVATFLEGDDVSSDGVKVTVPCSKDVITAIAEFELSRGGNSFTDLDGATRTFNGDAAVTNKLLIDAFAYANGAKSTVCADGKLCGIYVAGRIVGGDIFDATANGGDGNESYVFALDANAATELNKLTAGSRISDLDGFLGSVDVVTGTYGATGFPNAVAADITTANSWVLVNTSEGAWAALKVTVQAGTSVKFTGFLWK